jgi:D-arabinose 1-dehydrogenase-like Zn-dependent alcohol dehydrogenase
MRAMTVVPGRTGTAGVQTLDEPPFTQGELLVSGRLVGVCGTDREIAEGICGEPPHGEARLVLGHEGLGEVLEAPVGSGSERSDLVVGIVRRPDPVPCPPARRANGTCAATIGLSSVGSSAGTDMGASAGG